MRKASIFIVVVMALMTTACGGEDEVATTEVATTSTVGPAETTTTTAVSVPVAASDGVISITLLNYEFSPVSSVVTSGEPIVVNLENPSSRSHTWTLLSAGTQWTTWEDFDLEQILATTQGVPADGMDTLQFIAPAPGTYQVVCTVRGHIQAGMVAELVVEG